MSKKRAAVLLSSLLALLAAVPTAFSPPAPYPSAVIAAQLPQALDPPGTIDGSKTPELIPDHIAYGLVLRAMAEPENATQEQTARALGKIRSAGLNNSDALTLVSFGAKFQKAVEILDSRAVGIHRGASPSGGKASPFSPGSSEGQELQTLSLQKTTLTLNTIQTLETKLSFEGVQKMREFIQRAKAQMKLIP